jgi:hypothetical protein
MSCWWIHFFGRIRSNSQPCALSKLVTVVHQCKAICSFCCIPCLLLVSEWRHSSFSASTVSFLTKCKQKYLWEIWSHKKTTESNYSAMSGQAGEETAFYALESMLFDWLVIYHSLSLCNILLVCSFISYWLARWCCQVHPWSFHLLVVDAC